MLPLPRPTLDARKVYETCISNARPARVRTALQQVADQVAAAAAAYTEAATKGELHTLAALQHQPEGKPSKKSDKDQPKTINDHLKATYTSRMVHEKSKGRVFYNILLAAAPDGRCTLCGQGLADTLDHQLPKDGYPLFAVAPDNLVPACRSCNTNKRDDVAVVAEEQTLHPYFDTDVNKYIWLVARVSAPFPPAVTFHAEPPSSMPLVLAARVRHHFSSLQLARTYGPQAAPELRTLNRSLKRLAPPAASQHLHELAEDWTVEQPNSWQAALYRALAASCWYAWEVSGGPDATARSAKADG
ncbi:HNH endonuclease [Streptomyces cyaneofuscatus]|uniref:HNH endonuclease n=1 Tax=Streptomyces cyaneofuscatus TaxID=66883 RepID=UPI0037F96339